jgi:hypothetical protein
VETGQPASAIGYPDAYLARPLREDSSIYRRLSRLQQFREAQEVRPAPRKSPIFFSFSELDMCGLLGQKKFVVSHDVSLLLVLMKNLHAADSKNLF